MDRITISILFFSTWGFVSFSVFVIRTIYRMVTADKRRTENEKKERQHAEEIESIKNLCDENKCKDYRIAELEEIVQTLQNSIDELTAASAPLPDRFYGGVLAYDYRDVNIYVPDENFSKLVLGKPLFVSRAENNRYDKDAVSLNCKGEEIALLCRGKIQEMALDYLNRGDSGYAIVSFIDIKSKNAKVHLGFYKGCDLSNDE